MFHRNGNRRGFTLVELLTVIAIVAILVGLLFPAIQTIRESARKSQCMQHIRSLTMGLQNYHSSKGHFPMGVYGRHQDLVTLDPTGDEADHGSGVGEDERASQGAAWSAYVLPYIDQKSVYADLDLGLSTSGTGGWSVAGTGNYEAIQTYLDVFRCPSDFAPEHFDDNFVPKRVPATYVGCAGDNQVDDNLRSGGNYVSSTMDPGIANGLLFNRSRVSMDSIQDGASNTIIVGEAQFNWEEQMDRWYIGSRHVDQCIDLTEFLCSMSVELDTTSEFAFGSWHSGGFINFGFADGQTQTLSSDIDPVIRRALGTRDGLEKIPQDTF